MCRFLIAVVFLAAAGSSRAEDTPLEGIPLPRWLPLPTLCLPVRCSLEQTMLSLCSKLSGP